jgi:hypothetical protein
VDCREFNELLEKGEFQIGGFQAGELADSLRAHASSCPDCRRLLDELLTVDKTFCALHPRALSPGRREQIFKAAFLNAKKQVEEDWKEDVGERADVRQPVRPRERMPLLARWRALAIAKLRPIGALAVVLLAAIFLWHTDFVDRPREPSQERALRNLLISLEESVPFSYYVGSSENLFDYEVNNKADHEFDYESDREPFAVADFVPQKLFVSGGDDRWRD